MRTLMLTIMLLCLSVPAQAQQPTYPPRSNNPFDSYNPWDSVLKGQMAARNLERILQDPGPNPFRSQSYPICRSSYLVNPATGQMMVCQVCQYEQGPPTMSCL